MSRLKPEDYLLVFNNSDNSQLNKVNLTISKRNDYINLHLQFQPGQEELSYCINQFLNVKDIETTGSSFTFTFIAQQRSILITCFTAARAYSILRDISNQIYKAKCSLLFSLKSDKEAVIKMRRWALFYSDKSSLINRFKQILHIGNRGSYSVSTIFSSLNLELFSYRTVYILNWCQDMFILVLPEVNLELKEFIISILNKFYTEDRRIPLKLLLTSTVMNNREYLCCADYKDLSRGELVNFLYSELNLQGYYLQLNNKCYSISHLSF